MIKDLVSVIIPTFNRAHLIKRSAMSVLNQTYDNLELIIVDDGSTDNTEEVVKSIDDKRIIYIKQPNQGACAARNNGIDHAQGEFIAFQDSDDVWHEDKLEKQLKCLKETGADICFCPLNKIENGKSIGYIGNNFKEGFCSASNVLIGVGTQTLIGYASVFIDEKFDEDLPRFQDYELLIRLQKNKQIYYSKEPLVDYYMQDDSITNNPQKLFKAYAILQKKHPKEITNQKFANTILSIGFETSSKEMRKKIWSMAKQISPSFITELRIIAFRLGFRSLINNIKKITS